MRITVVFKNYSSTPVALASIMLNDKTVASFDVPSGKARQTSFKTSDGSLSVAVRRGDTTMHHVFGYVTNGMSSQYEITVTDIDTLEAAEHPKPIWYLLDMLGTPQAQLQSGR